MTAGVMVLVGMGSRPRMFAALVLISAAGIAIYLVLSLLSYLLLRRWHESAIGPEG